MTLNHPSVMLTEDADGIPDAILDERTATMIETSTGLLARTPDDLWFESADWVDGTPIWRPVERAAARAVLVAWAATDMAGGYVGEMMAASPGFVARLALAAWF